MVRTYIKQTVQSNEHFFDSLVINAIDFLESSTDDLNIRPKIRLLFSIQPLDFS